MDPPESRPTKKTRKPWQSGAVHILRVALVVALLWMIPSPAKTSLDVAGSESPPSLELIRKHLPEAEQVDQTPTREGLWTIRDLEGTPIASVARTLPVAEDVLGYRGPSEAMILVDQELIILAVDLIQSSDTDEHVMAVRESADFFDQFKGLAWGDSGSQVDGVTSATLTSLALAKGVLKRMGGDRPSLVFPEPVQPEELKPFYKDVDSITRDGDLVTAWGAGGSSLGTAFRTGPLSDTVIGYQGPTELIVQPADDGTIAKIRIRSSFDNEPYVGYCKTEYGFWTLFTGKTVESLAQMDLEAERVEGVSGATMTSMAIAETLVASAQEYQQRLAVKNLPPPTRRERIAAWNIRWSSADLGCLAMILACGVFSRMGWFRKKVLRRIWLVAVVAVIGAWSGNLISMALVAGWGAEGVAWRLAPALAAIAAVALISPATAKSNPYCNHLCPHGAIQQLVRPTGKKRQLKLHPRVTRVLAWLPGTMLTLAYVLLLLRPSTDLSSWEPFHAYLFRVASPTAFALAGVTLLFSAFVPMGYCRLGCPTGRLIDYLRRKATSNRVTLADATAIALLLFAWVVR